MAAAKEVVSGWNVARAASSLSVVAAKEGRRGQSMVKVVVKE